MGCLVASLIVGPALVQLRSEFSGAPLGVFTIRAMRLRRAGATAVLSARSQAGRADIELPTADLEARCRAVRNVQRVAAALIAAQQAGIALSLDQACARDLAGEDVMAKVRSAIRRVAADLDAAAHGGPPAIRPIPG